VTETGVEATALERLGGVGYQVTHGPEMGPDGEAPARDDER
jgi:hypothetical protein